MPISSGIGVWLAGGLPGDGSPYLPLALSMAGADSQSGGRSRHEDMLALFDELRAPLLRYLLDRRVPLQRAKEIVQEAFLELFYSPGGAHPAAATGAPATQSAPKDAPVEIEGGTWVDYDSSPIWRWWTCRADL